MQSKTSLKHQVDRLFEQSAGLTIRAETAEAERDALRGAVNRAESERDRYHQALYRIVHSGPYTKQNLINIARLALGEI